MQVADFLSSIAADRAPHAPFQASGAIAATTPETVTAGDGARSTPGASWTAPSRLAGFAGRA